MNVVLTLLLFTNVLICAILFGFVLKLHSLLRQFQRFITPVDEKTGSPAYQLFGAMSDAFSRSLLAQFRASFMGKQSGAVRGETAVDADIAEDALSMASPAVSAILSAFPALRRSLRRNPALLDLALSKIASRNAGVPATPGDGVGQPKFNL